MYFFFLTGFYVIFIRSIFTIVVYRQQRHSLQAQNTIASAAVFTRMPFKQQQLTEFCMECVVHSQIHQNKRFEIDLWAFFMQFSSLFIEFSKAINEN